MRKVELRRNDYNHSCIFIGLLKFRGRGLARAVGVRCYQRHPEGTPGRPPT